VKESIDVGLPVPGQPFSWAVRTDGLVFTAHGPVRADGTIDVGPVGAQARLTFENLERAMRAAGGSLDDVTQVQIQLIDIADMPAVDAVYRTFFRSPYPNRSSVAVQALVVPGMRIEVVAIAVLAR
jgi:2-iminobutanoate/2-iminopropanoate deaminase